MRLALKGTIWAMNPAGMLLFENREKIFPKSSVSESSKFDAQTYLAEIEARLNNTQEQRLQSFVRESSRRKREDMLHVQVREMKQQHQQVIEDMRTAFADLDYQNKQLEAQLLALLNQQGNTAHIQPVGDTGDIGVDELRVGVTPSSNIPSL